MRISSFHFYLDNEEMLLQLIILGGKKGEARIVGDTLSAVYRNETY